MTWISTVVSFISIWSIISTLIKSQAHTLNLSQIKNVHLLLNYYHEISGTTYGNYGKN